MTEINIQRWTGGAISAEAVVAEMRAAGGPYYEWGNGPRDVYAEHTHPFDKLLVCLEGPIIFYVPKVGAIELRPGDRLLLPAGTPHEATVGP
jgi:quercetin dioxygenase-like cupin family protein